MIELLVVMSIISIMTAIAVSNYNAQKRSKEFSFAAEKLASDMRKVKSNSMNILKHGADNISGGYGIHLSTSSASEYILFIDSNENKRYDAGNDVIFETITLANGITVGNMNDDGTTVNSADVIFLPPYGKAYFYLDGSLQSGVILSINLTKALETKTVKINYEGKIDE